MANPLVPVFGLVCVLVAVIAAPGCGQAGPDAMRLQGSIYGTSWSVIYVPDEASPPATEIEMALLSAFDIVNQSMSSYEPNSVISQFNALDSNISFEVDPDFSTVFNAARRIHGLSGGAYDVTVTPLLELWGFGPTGPTAFPRDDMIEAAQAKVGLHHVDWSPSTRILIKRSEGVALDFSSIAKGYGVDLGAAALDKLGLKHFMLEVGGEVQLRGRKARGGMWRIAIERPELGGRAIQAVIEATDVGIATSGDYRNFFDYEGQRYSHIVDPRSGYPIEHDLVSVTVVHSSTALADAWATALLVMGSKQANRTAKDLGLAAYMVSRLGDDLTVSWTSTFERYLSSAADDV